MVDSWYCLDRFVPEGISQVSRRSEVGNTKRSSLNTRLSSGTSAGTFAVTTGPYRNYHAKAGTKNEPWHVFGTFQKKGWKIDHHVSNLKTRGFLFQGVYAGRRTDFSDKKSSDFSVEIFRERNFGISITAPTTLFPLIGCGVDSFSPN